MVQPKVVQSRSTLSKFRWNCQCSGTQAAFWAYRRLLPEQEKTNGGRWLDVSRSHLGNLSDRRNPADQRAYRFGQPYNPVNSAARPSCWIPAAVRSTTRSRLDAQAYSRDIETESLSLARCLELRLRSRFVSCTARRRLLLGHETDLHHVRSSVAIGGRAVHRAFAAGTQRPLTPSIQSCRLQGEIPCFR
jgi:hypothetical protein